MYSANRVHLRLATCVAAFVLAGFQACLAQPVLNDLTPTGAMSSSVRALNHNGDMAGSRTYYGADPLGNIGYHTSAVIWNRFGVAQVLDPDNTFSNYSNAFVINASGQVAGTYGPYPGRPFIWSPLTGMVDMGLLELNGAPDSYPYLVGIADNGWAVGTSETVYGAVRSWLYRNGALEELTGPTGGRFSAFFISPDGKILGRSYTDFTVQLWDNGSFTAITFPGENYRAYGMNANGDILLATYGEDVLIRHSDGTRTPLHAAGDPFWDTGTGQWLTPKYSGALQVYVAGIDESGRVYGYSEMPPGIPGDPSTNLLWCWSAGVFTDVTVPGSLFSSSNPVRFNNNGEVVANYRTANGTYMPVTWTVGDPAVQLVPAGDLLRLVAFAINDSSQIIFEGDTPAGPTRAFACGLAEPSALDVGAPVITARNKKVLTVTVTISNPSTASAFDVIVTASSLGGSTTNSLLPLNFGTIKPGASKRCTLQFKNVGSGDVNFSLEGTSSLGTFFTVQLVNVP